MPNAALLLFLAVVATIAGGSVAAISIRQGASSLALVGSCLCAGLPFALGLIVAHYLWGGIAASDKRAAVVVIAVSFAYLLHPLLLQRFCRRPIVYGISAIASLALATYLIEGLRNLPP